MRKWHRWLSVVFGVVLLWIAVTGVLSQIGSLVNSGGFEREEPRGAPPKQAAIVVPPAQAHDEAKAAPAPAAAPFVCPADMTCRPKRVAKPGEWNLGLLHHLHSGESFGPAGTVISLLAGFAMVFFAFSGLWLYIQMWRGRSSRSLKPGWFWD